VEGLELPSALALLLRSDLRRNEAFSIGVEEEEICLASEGHNIMFFTGTDFQADSNRRDAGKQPSAAQTPLPGVDAEAVR
jgi:hypothetical protein